MVIVPSTLAVAARTNEFRRARCKGGSRLDEIAYRSASRSGQALLVPTAYAKNDDKNSEQRRAAVASMQECEHRISLQVCLFRSFDTPQGVRQSDYLVSDPAKHVNLADPDVAAMVQKLIDSAEGLERR